MYRYRFKVYRYRSPKSAQNVYFLLFFMHFSIPNQIYTSYTLQNHFKFILYPQLYSNHLSMDIFLPNSFMNHFKNHSNMGYNPYTNQIQRFVKVCSRLPNAYEMHYAISIIFIQYINYAYIHKLHSHHM